MHVRTASALLALVTLPIAACDDGGGGGPSSRLSFSFAELQAEEDVGTLTLEVVLQAPDDGLAAEVSAIVADEASGSATAGEDYVAFAPQQRRCG